MISQAHSQEFLRAAEVSKKRAQILNSCEILSHMQTLQSASTNNNYLYGIKRILADIQARAYNFMIKRISRGITSFSRKSKCHVSLPTSYIGSSPSRPSNSNNKESKNILFLNVPTKNRDTKRIPSHSALMGNFPTCCHLS